MNAERLVETFRNVTHLSNDGETCRSQHIGSSNRRKTTFFCNKKISGFRMRYVL